MPVAMSCSFSPAVSCIARIGHISRPKSARLPVTTKVDGAEVTTVEGCRAPDGGLGPVQQAFWDCHGLQCGFCTPGFVVSITAFLARVPHPSEREIREALSGNLCRCTGYDGIVRAVQSLAAAESTT